MPFSKNSLTGEWAVDTNGDLVPIDGESVSIDDAEAASRLGIPVYSDDANAPSSSQYFNDTDSALKYKDNTGTVHAAGGSGGDNVPPDTEYVVGGTDAPYQSIQNAIDASPNFALVKILPSYDGGNDTFPISINSETIMGMGRNRTEINVGNLNAVGLECINHGTRGPVIRDLEITGADKAISINGAPLSVIRDCFLTDCNLGYRMDQSTDSNDVQYTSHHCHCENIRIRDFSGSAGGGAGVFMYKTHNSTVEHVSVIEHLRGFYFRTCNSLTLDSIDAELNDKEGVRLMQVYGSVIDGGYFEGNSQTNQHTYPSIFFHNSDGLTIHGCRFYGDDPAGGGSIERAAINTETPDAINGGDGANGLTIRNCNFVFYGSTGQDGCISATSGTVLDWDLHIDSHHFGDTGSEDNFIGDMSAADRVRSNGIIIGPDANSAMNGADLSAINGAYVGDFAVSSGDDASTSAFDFAIWDGSAWRYFAQTSTV